MIKHIRAGAYTDKRTAVVIDSMKNKYESNYLRDRYSAYYTEEEMEQVTHLSVPLTAEAHWGRNWLEAKG